MDLCSGQIRRMGFEMEWNGEPEGRSWEDRIEGCKDCGGWWDWKVSGHCEVCHMIYDKACGHVCEGPERFDQEDAEGYLGPENCRKCGAPFNNAETTKSGLCCACEA